jgi:hypothetical protein
MLNSAAVNSLVFRRLTNREKPKLSHPTSLEFDAHEWKRLLSGEVELEERDTTLALSALVIANNLAALRQHYLQGTFDGLSSQEIATFAVADANRSWAILRQKGREMRETVAAQSSIGYLSTMGQVQLDVGPHTAPAGADDLNTSVVDSLPHWLAQAIAAPADSTDDCFDFSVAGARAQAVLSLEHAFREVWQEILWEPWAIESAAEGWSVAPKNPDDQALWRIWDWREQALLLQNSILNRHRERAMAADRVPIILPRTAVSIERSGQEQRVVLGPPAAEQAAGHRSAIEILESAYVAPFLDQSLTGEDARITPRLLELVVCVLQDLAELLVPSDADVEYRTVADIDRLSCSLPRADVVTLISEALDIDAGSAAVCIDHLTSHPFDDVGPLFRNGLWHRPLIATRDREKLQMVLGALVWGSPLRRVERWLQEGSRTDLSKTPLGLRYEAHVRENLQDALDANEILAPVAGPVASIARGEAEEEIDGLIRIGSTVLVLEIKCLLAPSDPIDRHDYVVKLESACVQAIRKGHWLQRHPDQIGRRVGLPEDGTPLRVAPLVVVNQSSGTGCRFGDCLVIDTHFLRLYLSSGEYRSSGAFDFRTPGRASYALQRLYSTAAEAEAGILRTFEAHPGLEAFRAAVRWTQSRIPLAGGAELLMSYPVMDPAAYASAVPNPDDLLARR